MVHIYGLNIYTNINGTTQPYGLICHNSTKFVHIGKTVTTTYYAMHMDSNVTYISYSLIKQSFSVSTTFTVILFPPFSSAIPPLSAPGYRK